MGDKAAIHHILARAEPRRIKHGRRSTCVDEFLVCREPAKYTFCESLEQHRLGFDVVSITSRDDRASSSSLHLFAMAKRLDRAQRRAFRRPPLTTLCTVQFAPSPHGPLHIRSIHGGAQALDTFLAEETLASMATTTPAKLEPRSPPVKRSSSAQAPTRNKRGPHSSFPPTSNGMTRGHTPPVSPAVSRGVRIMNSFKVLRLRATRIETLSREPDHTPLWYRPPLHGTNTASA